MATAAKPGAVAAGKTEVPPTKKSKKMLVIIIALAVLIGGGVAAYLLMKPSHAPANNVATEEAPLAMPPKYIALGTFTTNLVHEEGDRYLQVAISIKISKPELEEKIKATNPEILHHVNMLLQSKRPSELATSEGKEKLARDIKTQIEDVLGIHNAAPANSPTQSVSAPAATEPRQTESGIDEVLFTSFIIQ